METNEFQEAQKTESPEELLALSPNDLVEAVLQQRNGSILADDCGCGESCTD